MKLRNGSLGLLAVVALMSVAQAQETKTKKQVTTKKTVATEATPAPTPVSTPVAATAVEAAPTATPAAVTTTTSATSERTVESTPSNFLIGPFVTALALPRPFSAGLEIKYADFLGVSGSYGFFPELKVSDVKVKIDGWDARVKLYPFLGSFFLGVGYGSQKFTGSQSRVITGITVNGTVSQDNTFVAPHIGWNWGSNDGGFFMGLELGVQLSLKRNTTFTTDQPVLQQGTAEGRALEKDIKDTAETVGKTPLPLLTLIKVGYLF